MLNKLKITIYKRMWTYKHDELLFGPAHPEGFYTCPLYEPHHVNYCFFSPLAISIHFQPFIILSIWLIISHLFINFVNSFI